MTLAAVARRVRDQHALERLRGAYFELRHAPDMLAPAGPSFAMQKVLEYLSRYGTR